MHEIRNFIDLKAWQMAHDIRKDVYRLIVQLPESEKFNLVSQLRRASTSIAANIAEGFGRFHFQENIQFCRQARGSLEEVNDAILFAVEMKLVSEKESNALLAKIVECRKVLNGYIRYLQTKTVSNKKKNG